MAKCEVYSHRIHVWYIYLHLPYKSTIRISEYTVRPIRVMGLLAQYFRDASCSSKIPVTIRMTLHVNLHFTLLQGGNSHPK